MRDSEEKYIWALCAVPFVLLGALFLFIFRGPGSSGSAQHEGAIPDGLPLEEEVELRKQTIEETAKIEARFWAAVAENQPQYISVDYECPVDGTKFAVPSRKIDNGWGGIASDLMKIAIASPEAEIGPPTLNVQEWELGLASCPTCGASFMEVDLVNIRGNSNFPGAGAKLKSFSLAGLSPALSAIPQEEWTVDQRNYAHYLTLKAAGYPASELGFAALSCAYASNFAVWHGDPFSIPSAAYYSLAAAHLRSSLETEEHTDGRLIAALAMTCGELYRLLGRRDEAGAMFALAQGEVDKTPEGHPTRQFEGPAIEALRGFLESGSTALEQVKLGPLEEPPIGWYLQLMLPNINAHIAEHRDNWAAENDPEVIHGRIEALLGSS